MVFIKNAKMQMTFFKKQNFPYLYETIVFVYLKYNGYIFKKCETYVKVLNLHLN